MKKGGDEFVFSSTQQVSEAEVEKFLETFGDLVEMSKFESEYLRRQIEISSPMLAQLLKKYLTLELAKHESLMEAIQTITGILKEFMAVRYGGKEGEA